MWDSQSHHLPSRRPGAGSGAAPAPAILGEAVPRVADSSNSVPGRVEGFPGSRVLPWHECWKSGESQRFPPSQPARSACSQPRAAEAKLLASGRGRRWKDPRVTQISGRSPLPPSSSEGLRVDVAERPCSYSPHSCSGCCCLERGPGKPQGSSQLPRQQLGVFSHPWEVPQGASRAGPPSIPHP